MINILKQLHNDLNQIKDLMESASRQDSLNATFLNTYTNSFTEDAEIVNRHNLLVVQSLKSCNDIYDEIDKILDREFYTNGNPEYLNQVKIKVLKHRLNRALDGYCNVNPVELNQDTIVDIFKDMKFQDMFTELDNIIRDDLSILGDNLNISNLRRHRLCQIIRHQYPAIDKIASLVNYYIDDHPFKYIRDISELIRNLNGIIVDVAKWG